MEAPELKKRLHTICYHAAWVWFALFVMAKAWVSEDAFITFRVIDNFFNGYGLRWNINERVQAYTHPLWLLLHIPIHAIIPNLFLSDVLLSVACTTGAVLVTLDTARKPLFIILSCLFLPMYASRAFRDYTSSGLENPLSYLLFTVFGYIILKKYDDPKFWLYSSLVVALSLLNRLDMIIFYAPVLAWLAWNRFHDIRWKQIMLGVLPLVAWLCFSLLYYGFFFPNTKYAKLNTGQEFFHYVRHGLEYARYTIIADTVTALEIASSLIFIIIALVRKPSSLQRPAMVALCIALGLYWDVLYVISIGGDYMLGRFWAFPAFVSIWLVYVFIPDHFSRKILGIMIAVMLIFGAPLPTSSAWRKSCTFCTYSPYPMIDARFTFSGNYFIPNLSPLIVNAEAHHKFVAWAIALAKRAPEHVEPAHFIGMLGYYAGPGNILIDELGLADPLLARLPMTRDGRFFTGHFRRLVPEGYIYAVKTGSTAEMDSSLALYYEKLRLITSGNLFDPERLKTIIEFNLGMYDHWKQDYIACNIW